MNEILTLQYVWWRFMHDVIHNEQYLMAVTLLSLTLYIKKISNICGNHAQFYFVYCHFIFDLIVKCICCFILKGWNKVKWHDNLFDCVMATLFKRVCTVWLIYSEHWITQCLNVEKACWLQTELKPNNIIAIASFLSELLSIYHLKTVQALKKKVQVSILNPRYSCFSEVCMYLLNIFCLLSVKEDLSLKYNHSSKWKLVLTWTNFVIARHEGGVEMEEGYWSNCRMQERIIYLI